MIPAAAEQQPDVQLIHGPQRMIPKRPLLTYSTTHTQEASVLGSAASVVMVLANFLSSASAHEHGAACRQDPALCTFTSLSLQTQNCCKLTHQVNVTNQHHQDRVHTCFFKQNHAGHRQLSFWESPAGGKLSRSPGTQISVFICRHENQVSWFVSFVW